MCSRYRPDFIVIYNCRNYRQQWMAESFCNDSRCRYSNRGITELRVVEFEIAAADQHVYLIQCFNPRHGALPVFGSPLLDAEYRPDIKHEQAIHDDRYQAVR